MPFSEKQMLCLPRQKKTSPEIIQDILDDIKKIAKYLQSRAQELLLKTVTNVESEWYDEEDHVLTSSEIAPKEIGDLTTLIATLRATLQNAIKDDALLESFEKLDRALSLQNRESPHPFSIPSEVPFPLLENMQSVHAEFAPVVENIKNTNTGRSITSISFSFSAAENIGNQLAKKGINGNITTRLFEMGNESETIFCNFSKVAEFSVQGRLEQGNVVFHDRNTKTDLFHIPASEVRNCAYL